MNDSTGGDNMVQRWVAQLMDDDEDRRSDASFALHRLGRHALERALELARDPRPRMREMACRVLGQVGDGPPPEGEPWPRPYPDGVPLLVRLLQSDPDEDVRSSAAIALGYQAVPSAIPALCAAALDSSADVRFGVAGALGSFGDWTWDDPESARHREQVRDTLLRLIDDPDEDVRDWAAFSLSGNGHDTPEVRARLWKALDDPNPDVRGEASSGLARLGDPDLAPRLEHMLRNDRQLSPVYFAAAEELGDPRLLPAVLEAAERWRNMGEEGEELHSYIPYAIETLRRAAGDDAGEADG